MACPGALEFEGPLPCGIVPAADPQISVESALLPQSLASTSALAVPALLEACLSLTKKPKNLNSCGSFWGIVVEGFYCSVGS